MLKKLLLIIVLSAFVIPLSAQQSTSTTTGSFQTFEGGYMLWRSDIGTIWVFYHNGTSAPFPLSKYAHLSENPIDQSAPAGYIKPILGFGKVWGHFPLVRTQLGWALRAETGYAMTWENVSLIGNGAIAFEVNLPDGTVVSLRDDNTWRLVTDTTRLPPTPYPSRSAGYDDVDLGDWQFPASPAGVLDVSPATMVSSGHYIVAPHQDVVIRWTGYGPNSDVTMQVDFSYSDAGDDAHYHIGSDVTKEDGFFTTLALSEGMDVTVIARSRLLALNDAGFHSPTIRITVAD